MKEFLKYTLAAIAGFFIASLIVFLFSLAMLGAIISSGSKQPVIRKNSVLHLDLSKPIPERTSNNPFENFDPARFQFSSYTGLNDILRNIEKARTDDRIRGVFINLGIITPGYASLEEIRNALAGFRESGKFVVSHSDDFLTHNAYYLATVSDKIYLSPVTMFEFYGLRSEITFYKNALEKLGVEVQVLRHGKFKSAVEPFMGDKMSEENREQIMTYMGSIWNHILNGISTTRNIPVEDLNRFADMLEIRDASDAEERGLIDGLKYRDEVLDELAGLSGLESGKEVRFVNMTKYAQVPADKKKKETAGEKIAVIYASGDIGMDLPGQGSSGISPNVFTRAIREARNDNTIKAIVFRVNSPGGSAIASEAIWREVVLAAEAKPVVASMGNVAASGGYYILAAADTVLASPVTITGSIGVFGVVPNAGELLTKKIGLSFDVAKTNKHSDFGSLYRPLYPAEREYLQASVERTYREFVDHVAIGRGMSPETVDQIGQGRVWSGINALENGLVDQFGGLTRAIEMAAEMAALTDWKVVDLPKQPDPFEQLMKSFTGEARAKMVKKELEGLSVHYENLKKIMSMDRLQARLPFFFEIY